MPRFQLNDEFYNIPDDISTQFLQDNPDAIEITSAELGKITPPKEESQGVPVEVNATPEIQPTITELPLEDISSDLQKIKSSFEQGEFTVTQRPAFEEFQKTGEIKQELLPVEKIKEKDPSIIESLAAKTVYGITDFLRGTQAFAEDVVLTTTAGIADVLGNPLSTEEKIGLKSALAQGVPGSTYLSTAQYDNILSDINENIRKTENTSVTQAIEKGNYAEATELAIGGALQSLPSVAMAFTGVGGLAVFGSSVAGNKFDEEFKNNPDESLALLALNAAGTGATEALFERTTMGLIGKAKGLIGRGSTQEAAKILKEGLGAAGKRFGLGIFKESLSEGATEGANMIVDAITLGKDIPEDAFYRVMDGAIIGGLMGGSINTVAEIGGASTAARNRAEFLLTPEAQQNKMKVAGAKISNLSLDLQKADGEAANIIREEIDKETEKIIQIKKANSLNINAMNKEQLMDYAKNIDIINKRKSIKGPPSAIQLANDEIKKLTEENNEIISLAKEQQFEKTAEISKKQAEQLGIDFQSFETKKDLEEYLIKNNFPENTIKEAIKSDGFISGDGKQIFINKEIAKNTDAVNVASHELLHGLLFKTLKEKPEVAINLGRALGQEISKLNLNEITDSNFRRRIELYSKNPENVQAEEILTLFADATATGDIKYSENVFTRIGDSVRRILQDLGFKKIKFDTGRDVYNFIKDYNKDISKGGIRQKVLEQARKGIEGKLVDVAKTSQEEIEKFSKSISGENIQQIFDEKGKDGAFDIIEAYKPLTTKLTNKYRNVPGFDFELLQSEIEIGKRGLLDLINAYDPSKGAALNTYVQGQLANRSIEAANRILDTEFTVDVTEAKGVTDTVAEEAIETQEQAEIADEIKSLRKEIGLPEGLITDVKNAVVKTFGTKLPNPQDPKFRFELQKRFRTELKKPMLQFVGKQADYESFLRDNFESVYSKMPQSLINRRFKEFAEPVLDKNGKQVREKTAEGNKVYVKKKINKAEWIKYFLGAEVGGSTKGARKTAIVEGIAEEIAFDATMEVLNDPTVIQKYQDIASITGEVLPENFKAIIAKQVDRAENFKFSKSLANTAKTEYGLEQQELAGILNKTSLNKLSNKYPLISDAIIYEADPTNIKFSLSSKEKAAAGKIINKLQSDILKNIESENVNFIDDLNVFILNKFNEEVEKDLNLDKILENVINATNSFITDKTGKNLISKAVLDTDGKLTRNYFLKIKQATGIALKKEIAELGYESSKKLLENRLKNASKNDYSTVILNWFINESKAITTFNGLPNITKIQHIFNQVLKTLLKKYNIEGFNVDKNPLGRGKKLFLNNTPINRYKSTTDIKINFSEYTSRINDEAKKASQYILDLLVYYKDNNLINEGKAHIKLLANDQIGALRKIAKAGMYVENLSTKETTLEHQNPILEITLASNNFLDGKISQEQLEKEFDNAQVNLVTKRVDKALTTANLKSSGKNRMQHPLVIEAFKQDIADRIVYKNIKSVYKEGQIKPSKSLNKGFNQILEESTGVKWAERFSPAKARVMAKGKGKGAIFVPYSADDFVGLLYTTLSESEKGNQQMDWYRENLLRPFSRGIQAYESEKQRAMREWSVLKQRAKKDVPGGLTKQNESGFTNEQSLRMYIWQKQGFDIPNIKKGEVNEAIKAVNKNEKFKNFADNLMALNSEGYPKPENNWVDGDITTDLIGYINKTKRSEFLSEWQENVNEIFSEKNITKLRGLYGERYVEALENILYRMKTGVNRKFGTSKQERAWMDWVNNSVGAIMFFNARSAVLQTLSTVNFINFSDNNPINAAIALANFGQYRKDFVNLFNSDFLKQRRSGLQTDISADEIAKATKGNERSPRALFNALLKIGFTPTQIADSFAIASGGATFYRNRINKYVKEGLTKQEAEQKAFTDFQEIAEETQQSSRPDRVSMEQAGSLGRVVLAFANTPMQYARLQKKAALDLYNGRGDWKTNISKIAYYGVIQNIIFSSLQSALFTLLFDDEEEPEKKEKYFRVANSSADTFLRGMGVYGAAASTVKNVILEIIDQAKSNRPDYTKAAIAATSISPPINSKLRKLISAGNTFKYKQSREKVFNEGLSLENPAFLAAGKVISAGTNIPADRIVTKLDHIKTAMEPETELWQAIALSLGWGEWELGMIEKQTKKSKTPLRKNIKTIKRKTIKIKTATRKTAN